MTKPTLSPIVTCGLLFGLFGLMLSEPELQAFGAAAILAGGGVFACLRRKRFEVISIAPREIPLETIDATIAPYDRVMEEFYTEWKARAK